MRILILQFRSIQIRIQFRILGFDDPKVNDYFTAVKKKNNFFLFKILNLLIC